MTSLIVVRAKKKGSWGFYRSEEEGELGFSVGVR